MGTSSILSSAVIAALCGAVGLSIDAKSTAHGVLVLEQMLSTGAGGGVGVGVGRGVTTLQHFAADTLPLCTPGSWGVRALRVSVCCVYVCMYNVCLFVCVNACMFLYACMCACVFECMNERMLALMPPQVVDGRTRWGACTRG
jgi:hypothetical protein